MKAYVVRIRKSTYLTETMGRTNNLQDCMWFKDRATAELYLDYKDKHQYVMEIYLRKENGQWVAYEE